MISTNFSPSASEARSAICNLADHYSWETVAKEMISRMTGDQAREFVEDFKTLYDAGWFGDLLGIRGAAD